MITKREPNDDPLANDPIANFGSLEALIMPLLQQMQAGATGGMGVQGPQGPSGSDFYPRGQLDALRGLLSGPASPAAVPHFRQQLQGAARGGNPLDTTPKKNVHFS